MKIFPNFRQMNALLFIGMGCMVLEISVLYTSIETKNEFLKPTI